MLGGSAELTLGGQTCTLCDSSGGAVVRCSDCPAEYHVSCAWKAGHKFGFEVQPVSAPKTFSLCMF